MIKKLMSIVLAGTLLFTLSACGKEDNSANTETNQVQQQEMEQINNDKATEIFGLSLSENFQITTSTNLECTLNKDGVDSETLLKNIISSNVDEMYDFNAEFTDAITKEEVFTITPSTSIPDIENANLRYYNFKEPMRQFGIQYGKAAICAELRHFSSITFSNKNKMEIKGNKGCFNITHTPDINYAQENYPFKNIVAIEISGLSLNETDIVFTYNKVEKSFTIKGNDTISDLRVVVLTTEKKTATNWQTAYGAKEIVITLKENGKASFAYEIEEQDEDI